MKGKQLFEHYLLLKEQKKKLEAEIVATECKIYEQFQEKFDAKDNGTVNVNSEGYKVSVVKKENVTVDQSLARKMDFGFTAKYSLDKKAYKDMSPEHQKLVDACLTTKPAKPSFSVERIEDGD